MSKLTEKIFYVENEQLFYDWKKIEKIPEFATLKKCEQNPRWHREGNAFVHTKKVCEAMEKRLKFFRITYKKRPEETKLLMTAALFHDIGKGVTTTFKKGNWHAYGHEIEGEKITRRLLWDEGYEFREAVCQLVRWHMEPLRVFEGKEQLEKIARLSKCVNIRYLCMLKHCDIDGSYQDDEVSKEADYVKLEDLSSIASHMGCLSMPTKIPFEHEYKYKRVGDTRKEIKIYMMIGLPGAGKDTWIYNQLLDNDNDPFEGGGIIFDSFNNPIEATTRENSVVLSRDDMRAELGFCKQGEKIVGSKYQEDKVTKELNDRMKKAADEGKDIIIDGINLKKEYRVRAVEMLSNYRVKVYYVYVEASSLKVNIDRRAGQIGADVFKGMTERFEWPTYEEYDNLYIIKT